MSRRKQANLRASRTWARTEARLRDTRQQPEAVAVRYECPRCGLEHSRVEHDAPGCHGLNDAQLQTLRSHVVDEIINAVRSGAPPEHVEGVLKVLDVVDHRLGIAVVATAP